MVVVLAKGVELELEVGEGCGGGLLSEIALEGLVEALDLAAGLGMVWGGVLDLDAQALELQFESDLAASGAAAEDGGVVAQERGGRAVGSRGGEECLDDVVGLDGGKGGGVQQES